MRSSDPWGDFYAEQRGNDSGDRFQGLRRLVGNTPLLAIDFTLDGRPARLFAKSENLNMTGSIKDRMALHILRRAYERGTIEPGARIIEATSGNTGISFSAIGRALGHPVSIFMPDWMSAERVNLIRGFGAEIHPVSAEEGGFQGSIALVEEMAATWGPAFLQHQFANEDNCEAHETMTGPEIWWQLEAHGLRPDAIVAGVGTGGRSWARVASEAAEGRRSSPSSRAVQLADDERGPSGGAPPDSGDLR